MGNSRKMTNAEFRDMTRDFLTPHSTAAPQQLGKIVHEDERGLLAEQGMVGVPDRSLDDDIQYAAVQVAGSLFDALEDLGVDAQAAREITHALKTTAWLDEALDRTLNDYLKKLNMMGGIPKPRSI